MKTKRILVLLLSLLMLLPLGLTAFAAGTETGSITINNALNGNTFTLYKIFDLESYDNKGNYAYTIRNDSPLYDTVKNMKLPHGDPAEDKNVFALSSASSDLDYVQLTVNFSNIQDDGVEIKSIASKLMEKIKTLSDADKAKLSMRQIKNLGITGQTDIDKNEAKLPAANAGDITATPAAGEGNENKSNITFSNLTLGYYLVDSTAGTMIGLTTTNPDATITAKNELPVVVKDVKRNVNNTWSDSNSKIIGETVNYRAQVGVKSGATNYVIYDSLSEGLTFYKITKVYYGYANNPADPYVVYDATKEGATITDPALTDYFVYTEATKAAPITHDGKNCCFTMKFTDEFLNQVLDGAQNGGGYVPTIFVEYDAKLNEKAVIAGSGNPNDIYLTYGDNDVDVSHDTVKTYTYEMELVKTKDDKTVITGAEFEVYTSRVLTTTAATALNQTETLSGKLTFVKITNDPSGKTVYRVATKDEIDDTTIETTTIIEVGDVIIRGLGGNFVTATGSSGRSYYFKEIKAPDGYTLIPSSTEFKIVDANETAKVEAGKWISGGLQIVNKSGSLLPQTGGIGTTIFYIVGGMMLVGAAVLLITKRRMSALKESK